MKLTFFKFIIILCILFTGCSSKSDNSGVKQSKVVMDTILIYDIEKVPFELSNKLEENSGLMFYRNMLWTLEDKGSKPKIFSIKQKNGKIKQKIELINSKNMDWEDLAQDEKNIYIGDFGNNDGNKSILKVYKVAKSSIPWKGDFVVDSDLIEFSYPDQHDYRAAFRATNFDCEAFLCKGDSLYLFTKNWNDKKTNVYSVPKVKGTYIAKLSGSFNVNGLITGADISSDQTKLILCGINESLPFIWYLTDFDENNFFSGYRIKLNLVGLYGVQTEGICFENNDTLYLSNEKSIIPPSIFYLSTNKLEKRLGIDN